MWWADICFIDIFAFLNVWFKFERGDFSTPPPPPFDGLGGDVGVGDRPIR